MKRDYIGAKTVLQFSKDYDDIDSLLKRLWLAFCNFHTGDYKASSELYENILKDDDKNQTLKLNIGVCMFYLGKDRIAHERISDGFNLFYHFRSL